MTTPRQSVGCEGIGDGYCEGAELLAWRKRYGEQITALQIVIDEITGYVMTDEQCERVLSAISTAVAKARGMG